MSCMGAFVGKTCWILIVKFDEHWYSMHLDTCSWCWMDMIILSRPHCRTDDGIWCDMGVGNSNCLPRQCARQLFHTFIIFPRCFFKSACSGMMHWCPAPRFLAHAALRGSRRHAASAPCFVNREIWTQTLNFVTAYSHSMKLYRTCFTLQSSNFG